MIELVNRAEYPRRQFQLFPRDIEAALDVARVDGNLLDWENTVLWHSHPSGGVGPSRTDMRNRLPRVGHLVVTLTESEVVLTWY